MQSLILNEEGVKLTYTDSGAPPQAVSGAPYTTVFAVHGMGFNANVWKRLSDLAPTANLRFVALNRRPYGGSTPFSPRELAALAGSAEDQAAFVAARGRELAAFVDGFVRAFDLPPVPADGRGGGVALLPWSAGHGATLAALAGLSSLPEATRARFASHMRALIMYEPPSSLLGTPVPPATWSPMRDPTIPAHLQIPLTASWITSYFDHGDLAARDRDALSHVVPSLLRTPSVYTMSPAEIAAAVDDDGCALDARVIAAAAPRALEAYRRVCFDAGARALVPRMRVRVVYGEKTVAFCVAGPWSIEEDDEARGGGFVESRRIPGVNHFMQWDEAELALKVVREAVDGV